MRQLPGLPWAFQRAEPPGGWGLCSFSGVSGCRSLLGAGGQHRKKAQPMVPPCAYLLPIPQTSMHSPGKTASPPAPGSQGPGAKPAIGTKRSGVPGEGGIREAPTRTMPQKWLGAAKLQSVLDKPTKGAGAGPPILSLGACPSGSPPGSQLSHSSCPLVHLAGDTAVRCVPQELGAASWLVCVGTCCFPPPQG